MANKAFLVDTVKCIGCRACQVACKQWNNIPAEKTMFFGGTEYTNPGKLSVLTYNHVIFFNLDRSVPEKPVWTIMHKKCYHCEEANCMAVCPEKAISKIDGWVVIDQDKCIGCGACEEECIYNVPHVSDKEYGFLRTEKKIIKNRSYKCDACSQDKRDIPACAGICPTGALTVDYRLKIIETAEKRLKEIVKEFPDASIYGKEQFGGLNVITLLKNRPEKYGLEIHPQSLELGSVNKIKDIYTLLSIFTFALPSLKRFAYRISRFLAKGSERAS